jgi:WD40 repeat protein
MLYDSSRKRRPAGTPADALEPVSTLAHEAPVTALAFTHDGRLASGTRSGLLLVHDVASGKKVPARQANGHSITGLAFSSDDSQLALSDPQGTRLCCPETGKPLSKELAEEPYGYLTFRRDYVLGACEKTVMVWNVAEEGRLRARRTLAYDVCHLVLSPNARAVAVLGLDEAKVLDFPELTETRSLKKSPGWYRCAAFSPRGGLLACGGAGAGRGVRVWNSKNTQPVRTLPADEDAEAVAFTADGRHLISLSTRGALRWLAPGTGKEEHRLTLRAASARLATFSPDRRYLAAVDGESTVKVWDLGKHGPGGA